MSKRHRNFKIGLSSNKNNMNFWWEEEGQKGYWKLLSAAHHAHKMVKS